MRNKKNTSVLCFAISPFFTGIMLFFIGCLLVGVHEYQNLSKIQSQDIVQYFSSMAMFSLTALLIGMIPAMIVGIVYINTLKSTPLKQNLICVFVGLITCLIPMVILMALAYDISYEPSRPDILIITFIPAVIGALTAFIVSYFF